MLKTLKKLRKRKLLFEVIEREDGSDDEATTDFVSINDNCIEEILDWYAQNICIFYIFLSKIERK